MNKKILYTFPMSKINIKEKKYIKIKKNILKNKLTSHKKIYNLQPHLIISKKRNNFCFKAKKIRIIEL
jgi:hypothetical protein